MVTGFVQNGENEIQKNAKKTAFVKVCSQTLKIAENY